MIAGIDEAGRGSVIGPLVIALAEIKESDINLLTEMGVKDSKLLKRDKRKIRWTEAFHIKREKARAKVKALKEGEKAVKKEEGKVEEVKVEKKAKKETKVNIKK